MNDLEQAVRDTFLRHQGDAPTYDLSDAPSVVSRARRRQVRNVVVGGIAGAAIVIGGIAGFDGFPRTAGPPIGSDRPSGMCRARGTAPEGLLHDWPSHNGDIAGVYSWDAVRAPDASEGAMHNGFGSGPSGKLTILIDGVPGRLIPHRGRTPVRVAGCAGTHRQFTGDVDMFDGPGRIEEWMVDIQGTTVTISLAAEPGAPETEVAEAHRIIESIRAVPHDNRLGFRLIFRLETVSWQSG